MVMFGRKMKMLFVGVCGDGCVCVWVSCGVAVCCGCQVNKCSSPVVLL